MENIILKCSFFLISVLLCGCAGPSKISQQKESEISLDQGSSYHRLNVTGGYWEAFNIRFNKNEKIELSMLGRNFHEKWAPVQVVCVYAKSSEKKICINVRTLTTPDSEQLELVETVVIEEQKKTLESVPILGDFPIGKPLIIDVAVENDTLNFLINNKFRITHSLDFEPDQMMLGCSSVECTFKVF
jgi:hypothetical protein